MIMRFFPGSSPQSPGLLIVCLLVLGLQPSGFSQAANPKPFQVIRPVTLPEPKPADTSRIEFIGAKSFTPEQLLGPLTEQIREINERGLTKPRADDTAYYLAVFLRKNGFPDAEVNWEIRGGLLGLRISEGQRIYLHTITFNGNQAISETILFDYMLGATRERLQKEPTAFPFVLGDIKSGASRLRGLYESEGYLDAIIEEPLVRYSAKRDQADVAVTIHEGKRYTFGQITFEGPTIFSREELISKGLGVALDAPYTTQQVNTMERNLQFFYKSRGYFRAEVKVHSDPVEALNARVPVRFTLQPNQLYRFNGVNVTNSPDRLRPNFLPQRFASLRGEVYDPAKLDERYRELLRTGLFRNLQIASVPQANNTIRLDITAEEAKAKEVGFSIGYSSYEGALLGLRLADRNLFGNGRPLTFDLDISQRAVRSELLYVDPWFLGSEFSLRTRLYAQTRDERGYSKREIGARGDLTKKLTKSIEVAAFVQLENVEIAESLIEPQYIGTTGYQIATIGVTQSYDFRDNPINPSRGWILTTGIDLDAIAGEVAFGRGTTRFSYYHPIGKQMLLSLGARFGILYPLTDIPIDERYFSGGSTTVRSFMERELGPKDRNGYPIGGEAFSVLNAELTFPIRGALQGAVFVDAGNLLSKSEDLGFGDMRFALGVGLRYKLPIGPLRLDLGLNPAPREHEDIGAFHFSFGFAF